MIIAIGDKKENKSSKNFQIKFKWPNIIINLNKIKFIKRIGKGNIIFNSAILNPEVEIGDFNLFHENVFIAHDVKIKNFVILIHYLIFQVR